MTEHTAQTVAAQLMYWDTWICWEGAFDMLACGSRKLINRYSTYRMFFFNPFSSLKHAVTAKKDVEHLQSPRRPVYASFQGALHSQR